MGSAEDARRIRRQQEQRDAERAKYEAAKKQSDANVDSAGLRKFDTGSSEVLAAYACHRLHKLSKFTACSYTHTSCRAADNSSWSACY